MMETTNSPAVSVIVPLFNEEENMSILQSELKAALAEIIADEKNELEVAGNHFISGQQRGFRAPIGIRLDCLEQLRLIE